jgi:hypothetical protein
VYLHKIIAWPLGLRTLDHSHRGRNKTVFQQTLASSGSRHSSPLSDDTSNVFVFGGRQILQGLPPPPPSLMHCNISFTQSSALPLVLASIYHPSSFQRHYILKKDDGGLCRSTSSTLWAWSCYFPTMPSHGEKFGRNVSFRMAGFRIVLCHVHHFTLWRRARLGVLEELTCLRCMFGALV